MGITKGLNCQNVFIFLFLAVFPFGQVIRIGNLQPLDLIVGLAALYTVVKKLAPPKAYRYLGAFLLFALSSWIVSVFIFRQAEVLYGLLYLTRLTAYYFFGIYVWNFAKKWKDGKNLLTDSLLAVSVVSAILGWIQFFTVPDIKPFFSAGWDMHLFRLVGTFLDPTFLGLVIVFGLLASLVRLLETKSKKNLATFLFLLVSLAFTYSRASYLALLAGLIVIALHKNILKKIMIFVVILTPLLLLLPTSRNHSIELFRTFSAVAKIENYKTTLQIFSESPIFGVGYNNMCIAYQKYIGAQPFTSHACSGSDSSLLFILTTTGIAGFMAFVSSIGKIIKSLQKSFYLILLTSASAALLVHSLFSNSMFYPWIMGYMVILLTLNLRE